MSAWPHDGSHVQERWERERPETWRIPITTWGPVSRARGSYIIDFTRFSLLPFADARYLGRDSEPNHDLDSAANSQAPLRSAAGVCCAHVDQEFPALLGN